jgi:MFS family permease
MSTLKDLRPVLPILIGASVMLSLGMGVRQSFGLVMPSLTRDIALTVSDFALAMSVQNLAWGFLQPVAGALAVRLGFRPIMVGGAALYVAGLALFSRADGMIGVMLGGGVLIGTALACTASAISLAVGARAVPAKSRSFVLGAITATGSLGALLSAPLGQALTTELGWRAGTAGLSRAHRLHAARCLDRRPGRPPVASRTRSSATSAPPRRAWRSEPRSTIRHSW